jgi:hypothetical protein
LKERKKKWRPTEQSPEQADSECSPNFPLNEHTSNDGITKFTPESSVSHTTATICKLSNMCMQLEQVSTYSVVVEQSQLEKYAMFCDEAKYTTDWIRKCHTANGTVLQQSSSSHFKQFTASIFDERALWSKKLQPFSRYVKQQAVTNCHFFRRRYSPSQNIHATHERSNSFKSSHDCVNVHY